MLAQEYEDAYMYTRFEPIKEKLLQSYPNDPSISALQLSRLTCEIQQFMEDHLGRISVERVMTRLPTKLFRDYSPNGTLYTILHGCYDFKVCAP